MIFKNFKKIKKVLGKSNIRSFYFLIPLDIITSIIELFSISIIIPFVVAISDPERVLNSKYGYFIENNFENYDSFLFALVVALVIVYLVSMSLSIFSNATKLRLLNRIGQNVSQAQYRKYLMSEYKFHLKINKTELSKNLMTEVTRFTNNVLMAGVMMISKSFFLLVLLGFMLTINSAVSISIVMSLALIYLLIYNGLRNKLLSNGKIISNANTNLYSIINESLNGIKETKFYNLENYYTSKYKINSNLVANKTASSQIISIVPKNIIEFILFSLIVSVIIYLNRLGILIENLPVISFFLYSGYRALPAFQAVYSSSALIRSNFESVNRILKFEQLIENDDNVEKILDLNKSIDLLSVENINFSYSNETILFNNLSLDISAPGLVAIIGKSGSGKSTLVDLLLKLNTPDSGEIKINGNEYSYGDARSLFGYVPQNIFLSDSDFIENVLLGKVNNEPDTKLIEKSIELAGLGSFVKTLSNGLQTKIGENGTLLSGGQRKRLGLARAFYSEKPILILDEVTSGLDNVTEKNIIEDLQAMSKNKLIILITHNLQNIDLFDSVIDLNNL